MPFVSFEGVDGGGKSTQLRILADWLESRGHDVIRTREPGGGRLGKAVRAIFTTDWDEPLSPVEELLLANAARYDHVRSLIRPALAAGAWVLTDRFYDSTFALQVFQTPTPEALHDAVVLATVGDTAPDITFILDVSPTVAAARRAQRTADNDPAERTRNFERIRGGFYHLASLQPDRCKLIDADREESDISRDIQALVAPYIVARD